MGLLIFLQFSCEVCSAQASWAILGNSSTLGWAGPPPGRACTA